LTQNMWVMRYLKQQLSSLVTNSTSTQLYIDVSTMAAKTRLEKALNRREVLHYQINYTYDDDFMRKLYGQFHGFGFKNDELDKMIRYHAIFEIPMGSKANDLKKRYQQLAKRGDGKEGHLFISLANADSEKAMAMMQSISGVSRVENKAPKVSGELSFEIHGADNSLSGEELYLAIKQTDWIITEMKRETRSLETIFQELTRE